MDLLALELSRVIFLTQFERLSGQLYLPLALGKFIERYGFIKYPSLTDIGEDRKSIEFVHGQFEASAIDSFEIFPDGVFVRSKSDTDYLERFFEDVKKFSVEVLQASFVKSQDVDKMYESSIIFKSKYNLFEPMSQYEEIYNMISTSLHKDTGAKTKYSPFGLSFHTDQETMPPLRPGPFRLERRVGVDFKFNQYYSVAPLRTQDHIALIESLERLF